MRRRILLTFLLGSVALALFLALTTYGLTKSNLVQQRIDSFDPHVAEQRRDGAERAEFEPRFRAARAGRALPVTGSRTILIWYEDEWTPPRSIPSRSRRTW